MKESQNSINPIIPDIFPQDTIFSGFTTRQGGVSLPPYDSLNLGFKTSDKQVAVEENHRIPYVFLGIKYQDSAFMEQVHGSTVKVVVSGGTYQGTDGMVTAGSGILLCVKCADCIPLLLFDTEHMAIGVVHCGWKPVVSGIAEKTIEIMTENFGSRPEKIKAAAGPSAGPCCYEVRNDVAERLMQESVIRRSGRMFADLRHELYKRLLGCGLSENNMETINQCTICSERLFYSYRRDRNKSGRMLGYIMMKKSP